MSDEQANPEPVDLTKVLSSLEKKRPKRRTKKQRLAAENQNRDKFLASQYRHTVSNEQLMETLKQGRLKVAYKFSGDKSWGALIRDHRFVGDDSPKAFQKPERQKQYDKAFELYLLGHTVKDTHMLTKVPVFTIMDWKRKYSWKDKKDKFKSGVELGPAYEQSTTDAQKMNSDLENLPEPAKDVLRQLRRMGDEVRLTVGRALIRGGMEIDDMDGKQVLTNIQAIKEVAITSEKIFGTVNEERPSINVLTQSATIVEALPAAKTFDVDADDV